MWNYRVVKRKLDDKVVFGVHEAYYHEGEKKPWTVTVDPVAPHGDTWEELKDDWLRQAEAFYRPVLNYEEVSDE